MKAKEFKLLLQVIEDGINLGYNRAHKHTDKPSDQEIKNRIQDAVTNEICEWFDFDKVED